MNKVTFTQIDPEEIINAINQYSEKKFKEIVEHFRNINKQQVYLTRQDVADLLKVNISTVHNYCKKGLLKPMQIGGRVLFLRKDIDDSIERLNF